MKVSANKVVQFSYRLKDEAGDLIEECESTEPATFLVGADNIIAGLENAMLDKEVGEQIHITLQPEDAYGVIDENAIERVPVKYLKGAKKWKAGMLALVETDHGEHQVRILKAGKFMATVDTNHPLAGRVLTFDIQIMDVREATEDELEHHHVHGEGCDHH